jgi:hypothetical protein
LDIPVTIYQAQQNSGNNAALYFVADQACIVFSGSLLSLLTPEELESVIGHELAHYHLWRNHDGEFLVADRLLETIATNPGAAASHIQSARWYRLYTEIFADRGSLLVTNDLHAVVSSLVKVQTGLAQVSASSYLKQADEIFRKADVKTVELSHPEAFIRTRALALWTEGKADVTEQISAMIEGAASLDEIDLLGQSRLTALTRRLIEQLLRPKWFQSQAVLGHAKLFFSDFQPARTLDDALPKDVNFIDPKLREYLCFLLLDFAAADPELEEAPLAAAFELSRQINLREMFEKLATKELKLRPRDLKRIRESGPELLRKAELTA